MYVCVYVEMDIILYVFDMIIEPKDPVKAPRPAVPQGVPRGPASHNGPQHHAPPPAVPPAPPAHLEVRRLQAEAAAARREKEEVVKAVEALTVIIHHLANTYDPFSTPRLKADVKRLNAQLTETRLNLDESSAAVRRLQEAETDAADRHEAAVRELEARHTANLGELTARHAKDLDRALEKHRKELAQFTEDQQTQREAASRAHANQLEQVEEEWRAKLDLQHEKHLCALQELNTQHMHQVRDLESSRRAKERELEEANQRLVEEQTSLRQQAKKLEETLLNDTDHRLAAVRRMCASLKSEVDSLKSVVEMKNSEIHSLRSQVVEVGRLTDDLDLARERARALQAKTEDLQAQMEKKAQQERSLVNEHRLLVETYQRESNVNKRLSLENEELTWKLRQREELIMTSSCPAPASSSSPSSSLDLVTRAPVSPRPATPQGTPRSPRVAPRGCGSVSPCKSEPGRRRHRGGCGGVAEVVEDAPESPPPSPCVKAVVEKSNSVSFILELTGGGGHSGPGTPTTPTSPDNPFHPLSPRRRPHRTASLSAADRPRPSPTPAHARRAARPRAATLGRGARLHHDHNGGPATSTPTSGGPHVNGRRSASESSEGGVAEGARVSPTGLAWTVPVRGSGPAPPRAAPRQLLQDPQEDEYECAPRGQAPPRFLDGAGLTSSSEAASDSELSQCSLKGGSSPEDDDDDDDDDSEAAGAPRPGQGPAAAPRCPKDGAGEAMIPDELLQQYGGAAPLSPPDLAPPRGPRRRLPSAPSSDSDENTTPHNDPDDGDDEAAAGDASWSEDVDVTSSSELHDDL
ncbi:treacle protein-like isoform X4 [Eriocheir sinensis]|uniref:treacle protein-like isoform X4 n=1 Tax=Eriocheir sinensis TaxID=95602 RepID=UPI0021CA2C20|nr:treacle protein-like isoform X4 [Eriocheir sinensis]